MPLHTDHRPTKLDDIVGNRITVGALRNHLEKDRPNRSLLFIGESGCGKTTLAVCVAAELGAYDSWNFKMLNASDFRGIDTVRDVREASQRQPLGQARARVWLFDEAHKITPDGQEAMLKLLEDPPRNCWFMLATTNPEKLKITLRRRCTEFQVSPVNSDEVKQLMMRVARAERKRVPTDLLNQIAVDSMGSCGVALNILDKIIDLPAGDQAEAAKRFTEQANTVITLCQAMLKRESWKKCCSILKSLEDEDPEGIRRKVLEYFRKVMLDGDDSAYLVMSEFNYHYYDTGKAGLAMSVYASLNIK